MALAVYNDKNNMTNSGYLYQSDFSLAKEEKIPLNEYPRPQLVREQWINLNGRWNFAISKEKKIPKTFLKTIRVPYAVESPLSDINQLVEPDDYLIYQRQISLPKTLKDKLILLHFEGIDQTAEIYLDNQLVKTHVGIASFTVQFAYKAKITISIIVNDKTDLAYYARGKQMLHPYDCFYTSSSGIIKTVWLEAVNPIYLENIYFYPNYDEKNVGILIKSNSNELIKIKINQDHYEIKPNQLSVISLKDFHPWSIDDPYLYQVEAKIKTDKITSYFGVRKISNKVIGKYPRILLNNQPILLTGVLNQGYYFLGDLTPRTYQDYIDDITHMKELGFNLLRIHAKIEDNRFYYYCDKFGMLLIQDFVNGGTSYDKKAIAKPRLHPRWDYRRLDLKKAGRDDIKSQQMFYDEVNYYLDHFNNYPSIIIYTIFNEAWGEFKPDELYAYCKKIDYLHLFDTASGWLDAPSDFYSIHTYHYPNLKRKDRHHRPVIYSEVGGIGLKVNAHSYFPNCFAYKIYQDKEKYEQHIARLYQKVFSRQIKHNGVNMFIYTQLGDCEAEYNGLYTFDRQILKIEKTLMIKLNEDIKESFNQTIKNH